MAKKRGTPRRAKKKAPARTPARRRQALVRTVDAVPVAPAPLEERRIGTDGMLLGELGLVELKLSPEEEKVLSEPVDPALVLVKPNGAPYLPHAQYTRWFNRAFGRLGWGIVPIGPSGVANGTVVMPYVLYIHRQPVAFAWGEQEYFEGNRNQSYGDALESTVGSGLRRCAKRIGVGLELWDADWLNRWLFENTIKVKVKERQRDGTYKPVTRTRRRNGPPLPFEVGPTGPHDYDEQPIEEQPRPTSSSRSSSSRPPAAPAPDHGHHRQSADPISGPQANRLRAIIRNSGRDEQAVFDWLERQGFKEIGKVTRDRYDAICNAIESPGDLPRR